MLILSLKFVWRVGSTENIIRENLGLEPEKLNTDPFHELAQTRVDRSSDKATD